MKYSENERGEEEQNSSEVCRKITEFRIYYVNIRYSTAHHRLLTCICTAMDRSSRTRARSRCVLAFLAFTTNPDRGAEIEGETEIEAEIEGEVEGEGEGEGEREGEGIRFGLLECEWTERFRGLGLWLGLRTISKIS